MGIEPMTSSLGSWRSTAELLPPTTAPSPVAVARGFGISARGSDAAQTPQVLPLNYSRFKGQNQIITRGVSPNLMQAAL